jgi:hypothetical protein
MTGDEVPAQVAMGEGRKLMTRRQAGDGGMFSDRGRAEQRGAHRLGGKLRSVADSAAEVSAFLALRRGSMTDPRD